MINTYGTLELIFEGKEINYVLSGLIELEKEEEEKCMESLSFYKNYGLKGEENLEAWDNDTYLYKILYKDVLIPWVKDKTVVNGQEFGMLLQIPGVNIEDFKELKEMFDKAIKLGFFKEQIDESDSN